MILRRGCHQERLPPEKARGAPSGERLGWEGGARDRCARACVTPGGAEKSRVGWGFEAKFVQG